jgi:zinc D-Ala-D-Ala carboxypeptidase
MRNLSSKIPGATNFKYKEFIKSDAATRLGIDNTPNEQEWKSIEELAINVLQPIREKFGRIRITSGFRSKQVNKAIGGSPSSNHCNGEAADFEPLEDGVTLFDILEFIINQLKFRNVILEYPPDGWIHVDYRKDNNPNRIRLKDKSHNYVQMSLTDIRDLYGNI